LEAFFDATKILDPRKILQVSMDDPKFNHKFFRLLKARRNEEDLPPVKDCGTCLL